MGGQQGPGRGREGWQAEGQEETGGLMPLAQAWAWPAGRREPGGS